MSDSARHTPDADRLSALDTLLESIKSHSDSQWCQDDDHDSDRASNSLLSNDKLVDFNSSGANSIGSGVSHEQSQDLQRRASSGWWNIRKEALPSVAISSSLHTIGSTRVSAHSCPAICIGDLKNSKAVFTARDLRDPARSLGTWPPVRTSRLDLLPSAARSPILHYAEVPEGQSTHLESAQGQAQMTRHSMDTIDADSDGSWFTRIQRTPPRQSDVFIQSTPQPRAPTSLKLADNAKHRESFLSQTLSDMQTFATIEEPQLNPLTRFGYREYSTYTQRDSKVPEVLYGSRISGYGKSNQSSTTSRRDSALSTQQDSCASASQDLLRLMSANSVFGHDVVDSPMSQRPVLRHDITKDTRPKSRAGTIMNERMQWEVLRRVMLLFTFGFLFPPLWVLGGMLPLISSSRPDLEKADESKYFYKAWLYKQACRLCVVMFLFVMLVAVAVAYKFWWTW